MISADVLGLVGRVFCDFGTNFEIQDSDGEEPPELLLKSVSVVEGQSGASQSLLALEFLPKWRPSFAVGDLLRLGDVRAFNEAFCSDFSAIACEVVTGRAIESSFTMFTRIKIQCCFFTTACILVRDSRM